MKMDVQRSVLASSITVVTASEPDMATDSEQDDFLLSIILFILIRILIQEVPFQISIRILSRLPLVCPGIYRDSISNQAMSATFIPFTIHYSLNIVSYDHAYSEILKLYLN
jgi:hypothetical protein